MHRRLMPDYLIVMFHNKKRIFYKIIVTDIEDFDYFQMDIDLYNNLIDLYFRTININIKLLKFSDSYINGLYASV